MATIGRSFSRSLRNILRATVPMKKECTYAVYKQNYGYRMCCSSFVRKFSATASDTKSNVETRVMSGSIDEFMKSLDDETDVYVLGMPFQTLAEEMKKVFEGLDIQDIFFIDASKTRLKKICYIRFKDAETKQKALERNKKKMGNRYLEVMSVGQDNRLGHTFLRLNSTMVAISNLPFGCSKEDVKQWLHPVPVEDSSIVFISRGKCVVDLKSVANVDSAMEKDFDKLDGRPVRIQTHISRTALSDFKKKYEVKTSATETYS